MRTYDEYSLPGGFEGVHAWASRAEQQPSFVIDRVVHRYSTIFSGRSEAGKSTLARAAAAAIAGSEHEFLAQPVNDHGPVLVVTTDPGGGVEWGESMSGYEPDHAVGVFEWRGGARREEILAWVEAAPPALFIFDNLYAATRGEVSNNAVAQEMLAEMDRILGVHVPVLAVFHSSLKSFEDGTHAKGPMGSTAWRAWARHTVHVEKDGDNYALLTSEGNNVAGSEIRAEIVRADGRPVRYQVISADPSGKRLRPEETARERGDFVRLQMIGNPELLTARRQSDVAEILDVKQPYVSRCLKIQPAKFVPGVGWVAE